MPLSLLLACLVLLASLPACITFTPTSITFTPSSRLYSEPDTASPDMVSVASTSISRRSYNSLVLGGSLLGVSALGSFEVAPDDYGLWGVLPLGPYKSKPSRLTTIVPGTMWSITQKFGILNVQVPVRCVITRLSTGGLLVYNPVACTREVLSLLAPLVEEHGEVKHVLLATVAIEHKVYAGVFAQVSARARGGRHAAKRARRERLPASG